MIKRDIIARALIELVEEGKQDPKDVASNFVSFSKKHNMEGRVKNVLRVLEDKQEKEKNRNTVFIKTAREIPEKLLIEIKKHLKIPEDAPTSVSQDETMLGGFRVSYKHKLYEYGLKLRLNKLRNHLHSKI